MKPVFPLKDEFIQWLVKEALISLPSAKSYCSYVTGVDNSLAVYDEEGKPFPLFQILETNHSKSA